MSPGPEAPTRSPEPAAPVQAPERAVTSAPVSLVGALNPARVVALQRTAGNAAVSALISGRGSLFSGSATITAQAEPDAELDIALTTRLADTARTREDTAGTPPSEPPPPAEPPSPPTEAPSPDAITSADAKTSPDAPATSPDATTAADGTASPDAITGAAPKTPVATASPDAISGATPKTPAPTTSPDGKTAPDGTAPPDAISGATPKTAATAPPDGKTSPNGTTSPDAISGAAPKTAAAASPDAISGAAPKTAAAAPKAHAPAGGHGAPHRAGGHGGSKAHAPAEAAPAASGVAPELDVWRAEADAATKSIPGAEMPEVAASPAALAGHAETVEQERVAERPDFAGEAKGKLPAPPKGPPPAEQLDTKEADAALASVDAAGKAKLSTQAFPPMEAMPGGLVPPRPPAVPAQAAEQAEATAVPGGPTKPDPKAHEVAGRIAAVAPVAATLGPAAPVMLSDPGAASLDALPPAQATQIGDVAARVLADAPAQARGILTAATATLDPAGRVPEFSALAQPLLGPEQDGLTAELQQVAAAAGVTAEQLQAKVATQQAEAAKAHALAEQQLDEHAAAAKDAVTQRGDQELQQIGGASAAVKEEVDRRQEAAKGSTDPSVINARRDAYLEKVASASASASARLRAAKERRAADLQRIAGEQKSAYRLQAQQQAASAGEGKDATAGKIAARPILDWAGKQALEVEGHVAHLMRETTEEVERYELAIKTATDAARERIRDWAAQKLGHERSWWERLMDMVTDYVAKAKADNTAWEAQRGAETRDKVKSDFMMLARLRDDMAAGNRDAVLAEMSRMSKQERAVAEAFIKSGGRDSVGAVATGLVERIKAHRVPELGKQLEETAIAKLEWEPLNHLGANQTPGFDAGIQAREVRGAVEGWGTNEKRLFAALTGRTPLQIAAMRKAYTKIYERNMDDDIDDDVSGSEQDRADALRSGDPTAGAVATLRDAMDGAGTDEALIFQTLRGKSPAEREAITLAYEKRYGKPLKADLESEMGDYELGQADALLAGDTAKADAMALKDAMAGAGTDEKGINAVYARIRDEVEAEAASKGMKTAEVEAEIKRRNDEVKHTYGATFAQGDNSALEADFHSEMQGGELNLALGNMNADRTAMDAAELEIEHQSAWTSDDKVNEVLKNQYLRAHQEIMRDLAVDFDAQSAHMKPAERREAWKQVQKLGEEQAKKRSHEYMTGLEAKYNADALITPLSLDGQPTTAFDLLITNELSGYSRDEARERIAAGGKLSDAKELKYAIFGPGTNEQTIRETLKGKSKKELDALADQYRALTGNELLDDLKGDLSGRDEADMTLKLETGDSTPEERLAYLKKRKEWELGKGTGALGDIGDDEEAKVLTATTAEAEAAAKEYELLKGLPEDDPKVVAARERLERWLGYGDKDIERHREELDSVTDTVAMVGAITVGVAATILSAGALGPAVAAVATALGTTSVAVTAGVGAIAAAATSMLLKQGMKGEAYGGEDIAIDLVQSTADAIVAVATAGAGEAALKALSRAPAFAALERAAKGGVMSRLAIAGASAGYEGLIQGVPSGMMAAILDENTWRSGNPLGTILNSGRKAAVQSAGMAVGMSLGHSALKGRGEHAPHIEESPPGGFEPETAPPPPEPEWSPKEPPEEIDVESLPDPEGPEIKESPPGGFEPEGPEPAPEPEWSPKEPPEEIDVESLPDPEGPEIEESPPGGFEPEGPEPAPEPEWSPKEPPEEIAIPAADEVPSRKVGDAFDEQPTGVFEDGPTGEFDASRTRPWDVPQEKLPLSDLWPGTIIDRNPPLTRAEAERIYENAIADTEGKHEAMVLENVRTGERIVVQGDAYGVMPSMGALVELFKQAGKRGLWRPVRHFHPVEGGKVTLPVDRYPSGKGGDMSGARDIALKMRQMQVEILDIVTENGREKLYFGYDPGAEKPFFVGLPTPGGVAEYHYFETLEAYHEFVQERTGEPLPVLDDSGPASRKASSPQDFDDAKTGEWERPEQPDAHAHLDEVLKSLEEAPAGELDRVLESLELDELNRAELDRVLELIGQPRLEISELTPAEASRVFDAMSRLTFTDAAGAEVPVPFHYPVDGCWGRAHMMGQAMAAAGVASERIFATSTVQGSPLEVRSPFSADQAGAAPPATRWFYHVAPLVKVRTPEGIHYWVIDPSTQRTAVPVDTWLATMGVQPGSFRQLTHAQLMEHLKAGAASGGPLYEGFPTNERLVWTTDRNTVYPTDGPAGDPLRANEQVAEQHPRLSSYAVGAAVHETAAAVRAELARPDATAASVIAAVRSGGPTSRWLWQMFPWLYNQTITRFPADKAAIDAAIGP